MTRDHVKQHFATLGITDPMIIDETTHLLNQQFQSIQFAVWNFREQRAAGIRSSYAACNHVLKAIQWARQNGEAAGERRKIVYVAHPVGGDVQENLKDLRRIVALINMGSPVVPFVPYYADCVSLEDGDPDMRARGIENDVAVLKSGIVDEVWLTGTRISAGMEAEIELANQLGIPVIDKINLL